MQKHTKVFTDYYNIGEQDILVCQYCNAEQLVDVHHIEYRSHGGKDEIENLIGLGRKCHNKAHAGEIKPDQLRKRNEICIKRQSNINKQSISTLWK